MRIALSCIGLGSLLRGGELIVSQLATHLAHEGHDVTLYQAGPASDDVPYRTKVIPLPYQFYELVAPPLQATLQALAGRLRRYRALGCIAAFAAAAHADALREHPDIFVIQHGWPEAYLQPALQRAGVRTVALGNGPLRSDALMASSSLDAFVATNPVQAEWARYFHRAPVTLMKMGVDLQRFQPAGEVSSTMLGLPAPRVLLCGALIPIKRVELAIAAVKQLGRGSIILVGQGPLQGALADQLSQHLPGRHLLAGPIPHSQLPEWYRAADVLAFPSAPAETAGQVLLEAMACGTPVVASDDPIRHWLVGRGGITVDVEDARAFAAALASAVDSGQPLRVQARTQAQSCGWDRVARGFTLLCEDLLSQRPIQPSYDGSGADQAAYLVQEQLLINSAAEGARA